MYTILKNITPNFLKPIGRIIYRNFLKAINLKKINQSRKQIIKYKDIHKGKRCFIIGNGPSLSAGDLTKIKNEYSFATNTIYNIFNETDWRPTYYCVQDTKIIENFIDEIQRNNFKDIFIPILLTESNKEVFDKLPNAKYIALFNGKTYPEEPLFTYDITSGMLGEGHTITYSCMQMALYMGFSEIYLLGMDHSFSMSMRPDGTIEYFNDVKKNHFGKDYAEGTLGKTFFLPKLQETELAYKTAKRFVEYKGSKIFNATRGGKLEVFERVNFDDIIGDNHK